MDQIEKALLKKIKQAKTPKQVYKAYQVFSDDQLSQLAILALTRVDGYIDEMGKILKSDKLRQRLDRNGHTRNELTKASAIGLAKILNKYGNRLLKTLERSEASK